MCAFRPPHPLRAPPQPLPPPALPDAPRPGPRCCCWRTRIPPDRWRCRHAVPSRPLGIGSFTVVDGAEVAAADLGNNFFLDAGSLGRPRAQAVTELLQELNEGIPVRWSEVEWAIAAADKNNDGQLSRRELRAAIGWWYLHIERPRLSPVTGWRMLIPWIFATTVGLACVYVVTAVSIRFDAATTEAWLLSTCLGLVWKSEWRTNYAVCLFCSVQSTEQLLNLS